MSDTIKNPPLESSEDKYDFQKELKSVTEEGRRVVDLRKLVAEVDAFDKRHKERREKLKNGKRRRTNGRIL